MDTSSGDPEFKGLPQQTRQVLDYELERMKHPKTTVEIQSMSTRAYLDHTVIPILLDAMAVVAKERPPDPIEYLAAYLLKHKDKYQADKQPASPSQNETS
ncbi:hypothetical protein EMCRGX_G032084 [Ephydatia muelleri]